MSLKNDNFDSEMIQLGLWARDNPRFFRKKIFADSTAFLLVMVVVSLAVGGFVAMIVKTIGGS